MSDNVLGLRFLTSSDTRGRPITVLQYKNGLGEWVDVPYVYTEEVMNDHHTDWSKHFSNNQ